MSLQAKFRAAFEARGFQLIREEGKYIVFASPAVPERRYFLGRGGALRVGRTTRESVPVSNAVRAMLFRQGEELGA